MTFWAAVLHTGGLQEAFREGLQALRRMHRRCIKAETRRLTGSVDVDTALAATFLNDPRWDYAIGYQPADLRQEEMVFWVEVHPANSGAVEVVLRKLQFLKEWLCEHAPRLDGMRREFIWISSGKIAFTLSSPQKKQFAVHGLRHTGRMLRITNQRTGGSATS